MSLIGAPPKMHVLHVPGVDEKRDQMVADLSEQTEVCLHLDPQRHGVMTNWASAVTCASDEQSRWTWHLIVQDDMVPLRGWQQHTERALRHSPSPLLGLQWIGKYAVDAASKGTVPYVKGKFVLRGGAIAYHQSTLTELAQFARAAAQTDYPHDDMAACYWAVEWKNFLPALVTHSIFASPAVKSLVGHATYVTGDYTIETNPDIDWAAKPSHLMRNEKRGDEGVLLTQMGWN